MIPPAIGELIEKYLDASLSEPETRTLEAWMAEADANMDAFLRQINLHVGLEHALAQLPAGAAAPFSTPISTAAPRRVLRWRVAAPLAAAAGILLAFGLFSLVNDTATSRAGTTVAQVVTAAGNDLARVDARGARRTVQGGDALARGDHLIAGAGSQAAIRLNDGTVVDVNEKTDLALNTLSDTDTLKLAAGKIYCRVAPRSAGTAPFAVSLPNRCRAVAMGTRFELAAGPDAAARLTVEEGKVRLESPASAPREITTLQTASISATGAVSAPETAPLYAIAPWKFKPDSVPDNGILLQSAFESPESTNVFELGGGEWGFDATHGVNGSGCLAFNMKPDRDVFFFSKRDLRQKHFEISCDIRGAQAANFYFGPVFLTPAHPDRPSTMCKPYGGKDTVPAGEWLHVSIVMRGETVEEKWYAGGQLVHEGKGHVSDDFCGYTRLGLCGRLSRGESQPMALYVDNLVIRKIPAAPYDQVIFHDEFQSGSLENWRIFQGDFSVVEGQAPGGGRCLQLNWSPDKPAAIYANCDLQNRDFMMQFLIRTPTTVAYTPILSISTTNLNDAADAEHTGGGFRPGASIPDNQWVGHRFIVKNRNIFHQAGNDGVFFYERTARITGPHPYVLPGMLFLKTRQPCKAYLDNVLITVTDQ